MEFFVINGTNKMVCSVCKQTGHNIRNCQTHTEDDKIDYTKVDIL